MKNRFIKSCFILAVLLFNSSFVFAQTNTLVPDHVYFAGMRLNLSNGVRAEIEKQIISITKNKNYFQAKVNKADTYFPIVQRALKGENVPEDFKYLIIQESGIQADVVSSSNAVGFWQFKAESAREVGMMIDNRMDDRKHITMSSIGAAKYLKKNYLLLSNWLYALVAYNTGFGGMRKMVDNKYIGAAEMDLDESTHWYAIKFLAFKLAYEDKIGYNKSPEIQLLEYTTRNTTLSQIASNLKLNEVQVKEYNKWLSHSHISDDKDYVVILPVNQLEKESVMASIGFKPNVEPTNNTIENKESSTEEISGQLIKSNMLVIFINNGLKAIKATSDDNVAKIAYEAEITKRKFLKYNDMEKFEEVKSGQIYYLESKNSKGLVLYHITKKGESIWQISQQYGVREYKLRRLNRIKPEEALAERRMLYLRNERPKNEPVIIAEPEKPKPVLIKQEKPTEVIVKKDTVKPVLINNTESKELLKPVEVQIDSSNKFHLVQIGQTLYSISKFYGCKTDSIVKWNQILNGSIKFTQILIVSNTKKSISSKYYLYTVNENVTIDIVSKETGKRKEDILMWNDKLKSDLLAGEQLKIRRY